MRVRARARARGSWGLGVQDREAEAAREWGREERTLDSSAHRERVCRGAPRSRGRRCEEVAMCRQVSSAGQRQGRRGQAGAPGAEFKLLSQRRMAES